VATRRLSGSKGEGGAKPIAPLLADAAIEPLPSEYSDGAISRVRVRLTFKCDGRASGAHECMALAAAHRIAADTCVLMAGAIAGGTRRAYCAPTVEITASHGAEVVATLAIEMVKGTRAEADEIVAMLHDAVPAPT
jgi:hypothetical protein